MYMIVAATLGSLLTLVLRSALSLRHAPNAHVHRVPSVCKLSTVPRSRPLVSVPAPSTSSYAAPLGGFLLSPIKQAILGADFLHHFGLVVDIRRRTLSDSTTHLHVNGLSSSQSSSTGIARPQQDLDNPFLCLLGEFPAVTQACTADRPVKHSVSHHIKTTGPPVFSRTRRLAPERLRQEFDHMLELGVIRPLHITLLEIGDHVGTFAPSTKPRSPTDILFLISKILRLPFKEPQSSVTSISFVHTIKYR